MIYLLTLLSFTLAHSKPLGLVDKTHPRDNSVCYVEGSRLEILIRGADKFTDPNDKGLGEYLLYSNKKIFRSLPSSQPGSETYSFLKGNNSFCNRSQGFEIGKDKFAVLFLKENGSSKPKLMIQLFEKKTMSPLNFIETEYLSDEAKKSDSGFSFVSYTDRIDMDGGSITIHSDPYRYQDRVFATWMDYSEKGFSINPALTFKDFSWKNFFKDETDFLNASGWDPVKKEFKNSIIYLAVNHPKQKQCLLLTNTRNPTGKEDWRCLQKM